MKNILLLGIDGGATKINGWIIDHNSESNSFALGNKNIQKKYKDYKGFDPGFTPINIHTQLAEMNSKINLTSEEIIQGQSYINAAVDVITELTKIEPDKKVLIGFGMPGLKSTNKRGIVALANGPRMPLFAEKIEQKLIKNGVSLQKPISHLGSDADYCGIGEEYASEGLFKNVSNSYYIGGGTGVADALKLNDALLPFDKIKECIAKAWEMKSESGLSLERYASASGIQFIYSKYSGITVEELNNREIYPPQILKLAISNNKHALQTINDVSKNISKLIFERITTLYFGWKDVFTFVNPNKPKLKTNHSYIGTLLDRIIVGQRLGDLLQESKSSVLLWNQILDKLSELTNETTDKAFKKHYLNNGIFKENLIQISKLREAPVIGAGVDAYLHFNN